MNDHSKNKHWGNIDTKKNTPSFHPFNNIAQNNQNNSPNHHHLPPPYHPLQPNYFQAQIVPMEEDEGQQHSQEHANHHSTCSSSSNPYSHHHHHPSNAYDFTTSSSNKRSFQQFNEDTSMSDQRSSSANGSGGIRNLKRLRIDNDHVHCVTSSIPKVPTPTESSSSSSSFSHGLGLNNRFFNATTPQNNGRCHFDPIHHDSGGKSSFESKSIVSNHMEKRRRIELFQQSQEQHYQQSLQSANATEPQSIHDGGELTHYTSPSNHHHNHQGKEEEEYRRSVTPFIDSGNGCYNSMNQMLGMLHRARRANQQQRQQQPIQEVSGNYTKSLNNTSTSSSLSLQEATATDMASSIQHHHHSIQRRNDTKVPSWKRQIKLQTDSKLK